MTTNELYFSSFLRHQVDLRRFSAGLVSQVATLFERSDRDLSAQLRERLTSVRRPVDLTSDRWKAIREAVRGAREGAHAAYRELTNGQLQALSRMEAEGEHGLLQSVMPIKLDLVSPDPRKVRAIVMQRPFQGKLLRDWFTDIERNDKARAFQALQIGMVQGEPIDDVVRRLVGTRANQYADGILAVTRREATAMVRTAVNHISNAAREEVWEGNEDIIAAMIWTATLDGRTSAVCRARDGLGVPTGDRKQLPEGVEPLRPKGARPPAHPNCRSLMVAFIDGVGIIGNRPTVTDTRTRREREIDFRKIAKEQGKSIQEVRQEWAEKNVGRVPARTTYEQWLRTQDTQFQNEVLGKRKAELFRQGDLTLTQFVDREGNELTLDQLRERHPGLLPEPARDFNFDDGTPKGMALSMAFEESPIGLKELVRDTAVDVTLQTAATRKSEENTAFFRTTDNKIHIDKWRYNTDELLGRVMRHEMGHAIDYRLGQSPFFKGKFPEGTGQFETYFSATVEYKKKITEDHKRFEKALGSDKYDKEFEQLNHKRMLASDVTELRELFAKEWLKHGVKLEDVETFTNETDIGTYREKPNTYWFRQAELLSAYRAERCDLFVNTLVDAIDIYDTQWDTPALLSAFSDSVSALTYGEFAPHERGFSSHERAYWDREKARGVEIFAHTIEAEAVKTTQPFISQAFERFFPNQVEYTRETLKEVGYDITH